jgi:hypothetical protein
VSDERFGVFCAVHPAAAVLRCAWNFRPSMTIYSAGYVKCDLRAFYLVRQFGIVVSFSGEVRKLWDSGMNLRAG